MKLKLIPLTALVILTGISAGRAATHTWTGNGGTKLWSTPANWQNNSPPAVGEGTIGLVFPPVAAAARFSTNNIAGLTINAVNFTGTGYRIGGLPVTIGGYSAGMDQAGSYTNTWGIDTVLSARYIGLGIGFKGELNLAGVLSGTSGLTKNGEGLLRLTPSAANTYSGTTYVLAGEMDLRGLGAGFSAVSVSGDVVVGQSNAPAGTFPFIYYENANQIGDSSQVTILENGFIRLNGFNDLIGSLVLQAGALDTRDPANTLTGTLSLNGNVSCLAHPFAASLNGRLSLNGADRTFDVADDSYLSVPAVITHGFGTGGVIKTGNGSIYLFGANVFNGFTKVNAGTVGAYHNSALGTIANGTHVASGATLQIGDVSIGNEALLLNGAGFGGTNGALKVLATNSWTGSVLIGNAATINLVNSTDYLARVTFSGVIGGVNDLSIIGTGDANYEEDGTIIYAGTSANTFSGTTRLREGTLLLQKTIALNAINGPLVIGDVIQQSHTARVKLMENYQIANAAPIHIEPLGMLDLANHFEDVGDVTMRDGSVFTGSGALMLFAGLNTELNPAKAFGHSYVFGALALAGANRVFHTGTNSILDVWGIISNGGPVAGLVKSGPGYLLLTGANTYDGITWVNEGHLELQDNGTPGSAAGGTVVADGASLYLINSHVNGETLTIGGSGAYWDAMLPNCALRGYGSNVWSGNVTLTKPTTVGYHFGANQIILTGNINGTGSLVQNGNGKLTLAGTSHNSYAGETRILAGSLDLSKTNAVAIPGALFVGGTNGPANAESVRLVRENQIQDAAAVFIDRSGLLDLNNYHETIGSLAGRGNVSLVFATLTTGGNHADTTFAGSIGGANLATALVKEGTGMFMLTGTNTFTGKAVVNQGSLCVNGWQPQAGVVVNDNGFFRGHGAVGAITGAGYTMPGDNPVAPTHGRMSSASLVLTANSDFAVDLGGMQEGLEYDQLAVGGVVDLGGAQLHLTRSFNPAVGSQFIILRKDSGGQVNGQFAGLPEGTEFEYLPGWKFQITYQGGDGNDVVLTTIARPQPANIQKISRFNDGHMELTALGTPGVVYDVVATTNVTSTNWVFVGQSLPDALGRMYAADLMATNYPVRFYRFVAP
jgi:autotransporter-associated beta strand protein